MRGVIAVICLAAILAAALTPSALDWLAALIVPIILLAAILPETFQGVFVSRHEPQPLFLDVACGRAPPPQENSAC
jgi:hypothetical protein